MSDANHSHDDVMSAADYTVEELREVVFGKSQRLPKELALALLGRKSYPEKTQDMERVLAEEAQPPRLRHIAATELGRVGTAAAQQALEAQAGAAQPFVRSGVQRALAAVALTADVKGPDIAPPEASQMVALAPERAEVIQVDKAPAVAMSQVLKTVGERLPGVALTAERAVSLTCGRQSMLLLLAQDFARPGSSARLLAAKALPAVIAVHYPQEGDNWSPKYLVLTQPAANRAGLDIVVTTSLGGTVYAGTATASGASLRFKVQAVKGPGVVPVEIEGGYADGEISLERALAETKALPGRSPTRLR